MDLLYCLEIEQEIEKEQKISPSQVVHQTFSKTILHGLLNFVLLKFDAFSFERRLVSLNSHSLRQRTTSIVFPRQNCSPIT